MRSNNKDKVNEATNARRAKKLQATVKWSNKFYMREFYHMARLKSKLLGIKYEVDHIVPLVSKFVCGLHCQDNLRVITSSANKSKSNLIWENN